MSVYIKGKVEVVAQRDTYRGASDRVVPKGTIGYVLGRNGDTQLVYWPKLKRQYEGDNRCSVHYAGDVKPTGMHG